MSVSHDFSGRVAVVTGAGRGLGRAVARAFLAANARVGLLTRTLYDDLREEVGFVGERAALIGADVAEPAQVAEAFRRITEQFGGVDILINNAGIMARGRLDEITAAAWDQVMAANVRSQFLCAQAAAVSMRTRGGGRIINVSSVAGRDKSLLLGCAYTTSKAAVLGLTRHLAAELGPEGIHVNCICPSQHRTPLLASVLDSEREAALLKRIPLGYIASPEEMASVILFLASDGAGYMNGAIVDVNGGLW